MELPSHLPGNNCGLIGLICQCKVNGETRKAAMTAFSARLYLQLSEDALKPIIEADLRKCLHEPGLELVSFLPVSVPDVE